MGSFLRLCMARLLQPTEDSEKAPDDLTSLASQFEVCTFRGFRMCSTSTGTILSVIYPSRC
jgi:hypothetical protein